MSDANPKQVKRWDALTKTLQEIDASEIQLKMFDSYSIVLYEPGCGNGFHFTESREDAIDIAHRGKRLRANNSPWCRAVFISNKYDHPELLKFAESLGLDCVSGIPIYSSLCHDYTGKVVQNPQLSAPVWGSWNPWLIR